MVAKGKPAPDIFLHAAEMDVLVWLGGSHMTDVLRAQVLATQPMGVLEDFSQLISYQ